MRVSLGGTVTRVAWQPERVAVVSGQSSLSGYEGPFSGRIEFERRDGGLRYEWRLTDSQGRFLALVGRRVPAQIIPAGAEPFGFALNHAIEGIRRYRINRIHVFEPVAWSWSSGAA